MILLVRSNIFSWINILFISLMIAAYYVFFALLNMAGMGIVPTLYHLFDQTLGQGICQIILFFNILLSVCYEFANKLKISMDEDANDDPIDTEFIELKFAELRDEVRKRMEMFRDQAVRADKDTATERISIIEGGLLNRKSFTRKPANE
jgi:hypothetical protein